MKAFLIGLLTTVIVGCASLASPETTNQKIAYVYAGFTAVTETTADMLERDRITVPVAQEISTQIDAGQSLLVGAREALTVQEINKANVMVMNAQKLLLMIEARLKVNANGK
jgi:hypothetical protein